MIDNDCFLFRNPVLMEGYGSYGHIVEVRFQTDYVELLQRDWIIALAHIRCVCVLLYIPFDCLISFFCV